jgi:hypothetical protein
MARRYLRRERSVWDTHGGYLRNENKNGYTRKARKGILGVKEVSGIPTGGIPGMKTII